MSALINYFRSLWILIFRRKEEAAPRPLLAAPAVEPPPAKKLKLISKEDNYNFGVLSSLSGLLDELKEYFGYIKVFKKFDPEGYKLYSQVGGRVAGPNSMLCVGNDDWHQLAEIELPAFGMLSMPGGDDDDKIHVHLLSFRKIKNSPNVEQIPNRGQLFDVTMVYIDTRRKLGPGYKKAYGVTFYIHIDSMGNPKLLRENKGISIQLPRSRKRLLIKHHKNRMAQSVHACLWRLPEIACEMYEERKQRLAKTGEYIEPDIHAYFGTLLRVALSPFVFGEGGFRVNCKKGPLMAVFNIETERSPYFFRHREKTVTSNGRTRPIFHAVRAHKRMNESTVKMHFRGEREFNWNGYAINITVPGKHHADLINFTASAEIHDEDGPIPEGVYDNEALGKFIAQQISGGQPAA